MDQKLLKSYIYSAGVFLAITAIAKFISGSGNAGILQNADPILRIPFKYVFWVVGLMEVVVALFCFFGKTIGLQAGLVACLASNFVMYRLGLILVGWQRPCPCLGNLTDALHIPPQTADTAMKIILAYLLIGSYATLFWLWRQRKMAVQAP